MLDTVRFRVATWLAGDLIDKLAMGVGLSQGNKQYMAGYRQGVADTRLLADLRGGLRVVDGGGEGDA